MAGYYGPDYRSARRGASQNPYRASIGHAPSHAPSGYGAAAPAWGARESHFVEPSDYGSYYDDDDITDDSVSEDFQRMSVSGRNHGPQVQPQSARYPGHHYSASIGAPASARAPPPRASSPTESAYSHATTSRASAYASQAYQKPAPSKSLDRYSHYLQKGYRFAGPYRGEEDNVEPEYQPEDRSRGVVTPARTRPRSVRRSSSTDARGREKSVRHGPSYYAETTKSSRRPNSAGPHDRIPRERQPDYGRRQPKTPGMMRRSSSIGRFDISQNQLEKPEPAPSASGALVRRSKSVSASTRSGWNRRRSLGQVTATVVPNEVNSAATAVRLDLGGREVDIAVNDHHASKRRGPTIGSITINQNGPAREAGPAPSEAGKNRETASQMARDERMRRFLGDVEASSPPSSPSDDEFARMEQRMHVQRRARSASLGTTLNRRKVPLQIAGPPGPINAPQMPPQGNELKHTRISRKIITRQALEEYNYEYEETGDTFTVFHILQPDEIDDLMDLTARIRAARHDKRRARSRGERQGSVEYGFNDAFSFRNAPSMRPIVSQQHQPYGYGERQAPPPGPPMPGAWPSNQQPPPRQNVSMPDHVRYQRSGPGTAGGPQPAMGRGYSREGRRYY